MFETVNRSWSLTKQSFQVLSQQKVLAVFPILSSLALILVVASYLVPVVILQDMFMSSLDSSIQSFVSFIAFFVFYFLANFVMVFFNVAILECVKLHFEGGKPSLGYGFNAAMKSIGLIVQWAAIGGFIGVVLKLIEEKLGVGGSIIRKLIGGAWSIVSFFAVPVMIFEQTSPINAMKKSGEIIKKTWGESLSAYLGLSMMQTVVSVIFVLGLILVGVLSVVLSTPILAMIALPIMVLSLVVITVIFSTLTQIYRSALYIYATTGDVPSIYSEDLMQDAFRTDPKKK